jgi:hypothetical protein
VVGRPIPRSVDSACESRAIEPRNLSWSREPLASKSPGAAPVSRQGQGHRSRRGLRTRRTHTRVPQEPGRSVPLHGNVGWGVPNPKLPGPRPGIQGRGERNTGGSTWYRRAKTTSTAGRMYRSRSALIVPDEAGTPNSEGPRGGKGGVESSNRWRETCRRHRTPRTCSRNDSG